MSLCLCGEIRAGEEPKKKVRAAKWDWVLPGERYKKLSVFERAQYDKAAVFFKGQDYRAAAAEFAPEETRLKAPLIVGGGGEQGEGIRDRHVSAPASSGRRGPVRRPVPGSPRPAAFDVSYVGNNACDHHRTAFQHERRTHYMA